MNMDKVLKVCNENHNYNGNEVHTSLTYLNKPRYRFQLTAQPGCIFMSGKSFPLMPAKGTLEDDQITLYMDMLQKTTIKSDFYYQRPLNNPRFRVERSIGTWHREEPQELIKHLFDAIASID
jgi:hypothetical protein